MNENKYRVAMLLGIATIMGVGTDTLIKDLLRNIFLGVAAVVTEPLRLYIALYNMAVIFTP